MNRIAIRKPLEILACQDAATRLRSADYAELEGKLEAIAEKGSPQADEKIHNYIWERAENDLLVRTLKQISAPMFAFISVLRDSGMQDIRARVDSHRELIAVLRSRNPEKIAHAVEGHLESAYAAFTRSDMLDLKMVSEHQRSKVAVSAGASGNSCISLQRTYLRWVPAVAIIRDSESRLVWANKEFERFFGYGRSELRGKTPDAHLPSEVARSIVTHERVVREQRISFLTVERLRGRRMTLRFPIEFDGQVLTGALGFDLTATGRASGEGQMKNTRVLWEPESELDSVTSVLEVSSSLTTAFLNAVPAIATLKDLHGRMVFANIEYESVTGKRRDDAVGHLPTENWGDVGEQILEHDATVRRTRKPHLTFDRLPVGGGELQRVNIRFPVFDDENNLEMTASLGFDLALVQRGSAMLDQLEEGAQMWAPLCDTSGCGVDQG